VQDLLLNPAVALSDGTVQMAAGHTLSVKGVSDQATIMHEAAKVLRCAAANDQWIVIGTEHGQLIVLRRLPEGRTE